MPKPMRNETVDPVVDEIHATRRRLLEEHGGLAGLAAYLRKKAEERVSASGTNPNKRRITLPPKPDQTN